jgi:glycosyltransferase involved in cell wall biosynthesis
MSKEDKRGICVVIPTKDNMRTIQECMESATQITKNIVIVDSGSTDGTVALCEKYGAKVIHREWVGMVKQRQFCLDQGADYDWVVALDSDEMPDKILQDSIKALLERDLDLAIEGFTFNRKVWFYNGWLNHVFQPEYRLRVVRGGVATVEGVGHDQLRVAGRISHLQGTCKHDSWSGLDDMLQSYIRLGRYAAENESKTSNPFMILSNPLLAFFKQYVLKKGYKDGRRGLIVSVGVACGNMIKQLQKNQEQWSREG